MRRLAWLVVAVGLIGFGCTNVGPGPEGLGPEPSRGLALADRIEATGRATDWYSLLVIEDGKPKVSVYGAGDNNGVDLPGGEAWVFIDSSATEALATSVCAAVAAVVNDPTQGPSLSLTDIWVYRGTAARVQCFPPQKP